MSAIDLAALILAAVALVAVAALALVCARLIRVVNDLRDATTRVRGVRTPGRPPDGGRRPLPRRPRSTGSTT